MSIANGEKIFFSLQGRKIANLRRIAFHRVKCLNEHFLPLVAVIGEPKKVSNRGHKTKNAAGSGYPAAFLRYTCLGYGLV